MPNVNAVLNEQIKRVARRVVNASIVTARKLVARHRREIASLKRLNKALEQRLVRLEKTASSPIVAAASAPLEKFRFRADGMRSHRAKLGLSAADYGQLLGVSELTVYKWESGKAKPRKSYSAIIAQVRELGKREAFARLGLKGGDAQPADRPRRGRGAYEQTASEWVLGFLKSHKNATTAQINEAWSKAGRGKTADTTLSTMARAGTIKRKKLNGQRGSTYTL